MMKICDICKLEIKGKAYKWEGLSPIYCSPKCAAFGCPNALLCRTNGNDK